MIRTEKDIALIEKYIDGDLSVKDIELFDERLKNDHDFANAYNNRIKLSTLWKEADEYQKTKDEISIILKNKNNSFFITHRYYIVSIAASLLILLGVYLLFFQMGESFKMDEQIVLKDSSTLTDDSISFQIDEPTKLATIEILKNPVKLISPKGNVDFAIDEEIVFTWFSSSEDVDTLLVWSKSKKTIVINKVIHQKRDTLNYNFGLLPKGEYSWYFNDTLLKQSFTVSNKK